VLSPAPLFSRVVLAYMDLSGIYHPYCDSAYAEALDDFGVPIEVAPWGSWILRQSIGDSGFVDAMGLYPLLAFASNTDIGAGRAILEAAGLVSFVGVADPFAAPPVSDLAREFDVCSPFKQHMIIDRRLGAFDFSRHHRYEIRRAHRSCRVERLPLRDHLDRWIELYDELIAHQNIKGIQCFSRRYFERIAEMPTLGCFAARQDGAIVAMTLWFRGDRIAYFHLGASSAAGYRTSASYALVAAAIEQYADCEIVNLGGGPGLTDDNNGLVQFKRGFANSSACSHLCGMILDRAGYTKLAGDAGNGQYFPVYRGPGKQCG
jgi:Acetyltransferase (GNAT) domain